MKLEWSRRAARDLIAIGDHVAEARPAAAADLVRKLLGRARSIVDFPQLGRMVPEFGEPTIRELVEGNYRLVYRVSKSKVTVLTVFEAHHPIPLTPAGRKVRRKSNRSR